MTAGLFIVLGIAIALTDSAAVRRISSDVCESEVYCTGELLKTVQLSYIFNDSKSFVDLQQLNDPQVTIANFNKLMKATNNKPNRTQIIRYVNENFASNDEIHNWTLPDWKPNPSILKRIVDPKYREWINELHGVWKKLAKKMNDDVARHPERHSLIYVENGFIVPGGRFKEFYYWDSYWVIEGLLLSDMHQTAKGMIDNFLSMVEKYGFIPNGGRVYYLMRSQPPMLIPMMARYLNFTADHDYLRSSIPTLEKEFAFWQRQKTVEVKKNGKTYKMARYVVDSPRPRPESYREDYEIAQKVSDGSRDTFYNNIKAGAESGWDFSHRWCIGKNENDTLSLLDISTQDIIPVELNAILERNARLLGEFHTILGNKAKAQYYAKVALDYQLAIDNILWNEASGTWLDYDTKNNRPRKAFYPTNLAPLYTGSYDRSKVDTYALAAVRYLKAQGIDVFFGGTPSSLSHTGEQWDFPNAWPPLQSFLIMGLWRTGVKEAVNLAEELAFRWLRSNYIGYSDTGKMFEKYDATMPGQGGGGGEYTLQEGFGWTNGVVFEFLNVFPAANLHGTFDGGVINEQ